MKTPFLKRIVSTAARSLAEGMVVTDPLVYHCYLRCTAEEGAAPHVRKHVSGRVTEVIAAHE